MLVVLKKVSIPSSPSDFRPKALLCFLSKVLEKLAHDQITLFLNHSKFLDHMQTGSFGIDQELLEILSEVDTVYGIITKLFQPPIDGAYKCFVVLSLCNNN